MHFSLFFDTTKRPKNVPRSIEKRSKNRLRTKTSQKALLGGSWASLGLSHGPFGALPGTFLGCKMGHKRAQKGTKKGHGVRRGLWTVLGTALVRFWTPHGRLLGASGPLLGISRGLRGCILVVLERISGFPGLSPNFLLTFSPHSPYTLSNGSPLCRHVVPTSSPLSPHILPTFCILSLNFLPTFSQLLLHFLPAFSSLPLHFLPTFSPHSPCSL